jgi:hypothetical protein
MPRIDDYADLLRALGRFLDEQEATSFEMINHLGFLALSWDRPTSQGYRQAYQEHQLEALRVEARTLRTSAGGPAGSLVELLRTLGQELEREGVELAGITRDAAGFHVSGFVEQQHFRAVYRSKDLIALGIARSAARGPTEAEPEAMAPRPPVDSFLGVTVGAPVYAEDGQRLGIVSEIRGRYFRLGNTYADGEYWLPAESVGSIGPGDRVVLTAADERQ